MGFCFLDLFLFLCLFLCVLLSLFLLICPFHRFCPLISCFYLFQLYLTLFLFVFLCLHLSLYLCFSLSSVHPSPGVCLPPACRNNNLSFLRPYYQTEEGEENPFICSSRRDNGMQKCSHIPSRRELRVECTLGWEAYGQPQAEGAAGTARNACINWNQYYNVCRSGGANPHNGAINFDNIGYAWIAIFQVGPRSRLRAWASVSPSVGVGGHCVCGATGGRRRGGPCHPPRAVRVCSRLPPQVITLEGWVDIMYYVMDAHSFYNFIYFILLIIVSAGDGASPGGWVGCSRPPVSVGGGALTAGQPAADPRSPLSVGVVVSPTPCPPSLP